MIFLGTRNQYVAALAAIRGETAKMDIFSMSQLDRPRVYSMLLFSWGMTADADLESDRYFPQLHDVVLEDANT